MKKNISQNKGGGKEKIQKVTEEFTGKNLTRFGGVGLIRRFFKRHKVGEHLGNIIYQEGRRESKYGKTMFLHILYGMFLGQSRPYHMGVFSSDKVFQQAAGFIGFPVQSTISRFLSALRVKAAHRIAEINFSFLMKFRKNFKGLKSITLDLDSHVTSVYGKQQRAGLGYNPKKKGRKSYHPLLCFIGETRDYIGGVFRSGERHTSFGAIRFLKSILKKLPSHIEKIRFRADSGFFNLDMLKFLDKNHMEFYVVLPLQPWVQKKILFMGAWQKIGSRTDVSECEFVVAKDLIFRMVVVRKKIGQKESPKKQLKLLHAKEIVYDYQVIVTNSTLDSEAVWQFYNQRACCENFIKEGIYGFGLDKIVSHSYAGNYAYFELLMLGYNLMNFFKEEVLDQKKKKDMAQTIRERLFLIPGRLIRSSGKLILKLERTWFFKDDYEKALAKVV